MSEKSEILVTSANPKIRESLARVASNLTGIAAMPVDLDSIRKMDSRSVLSYCRDDNEFTEIISAHWHFGARGANRSSPCGTLIASSFLAKNLGVSNEDLHQFGLALYSLDDLVALLCFVSRVPEFVFLRGLQNEPVWLVRRRLKHMWHGKFVRRHCMTLDSVLSRLSDGDLKLVLEKSRSQLVADYRELLRILLGDLDD